ncbi:MAG: hypothetical protein Q4P20_07365 [Eubacteriales bacterium]|nr:hypothetical protein [Eubacteriales bacterium]
MKNYSIYDKAGTYCDLAASKLGDAQTAVRAGCDFAQSRISSLLANFVLSEVCVLKMMLISFGILIGTLFSDFFKKHRKLVVVAFLVSVALFVYKAFQLIGDWDEVTDDF